MPVGRSAEEGLELVGRLLLRGSYGVFYMCRIWGGASLEASHMWSWALSHGCDSMWTPSGGTALRPSRLAMRNSGVEPDF
jgi:hypothetical protein